MCSSKTLKIKNGEDPLGISGVSVGTFRRWMPLPPDFPIPNRDVNANGAPLRNWCGLHFFWLVCRYLFGGEWASDQMSPARVRERQIFGLDIPDWLAWTGLRLLHVPRYLRQRKAKLFVNGRLCVSFPSFAREVLRCWLAKPSVEDALDLVSDAVKGNCPVGLDLRLPGFGREHVVFVYALTHDEIVVADSVRLPSSDLYYEKVSSPDDPRLLMAISLEEFRRIWSRRGCGVWHVEYGEYRPRPPSTDKLAA